jgi:hypothetical protein
MPKLVNSERFKIYIIFLLLEGTFIMQSDVFSSDLSRKTF